MLKYTNLEGWARDNLSQFEFCKSDDERVIFVCGSSGRVQRIFFDNRKRYEDEVLYLLKEPTVYSLVTPPSNFTNPKGNDMTLYTWTLDTTTFYGTQLAINSSGKWVMEVKGSGNVVAIDPEIIEEVVPHTVDVQFLGNHTHNYSYWAPAGKYAVNDLLLVNAPQGLAMVLVTKVDTKSKKANKDLPVVGKIALDTAITN